MGVCTYKIIPDTSSNTISYSRNFRIFTVETPIQNAKNITEILETVNLGSAINSKLIRSFRYSKDKESWSLWYNYDPSDPGHETSPAEGGFDDILLLMFEPTTDYYFQFKYEYDDGTMNQLVTPITISEIKVRVSTKNIMVPLSELTPSVSCSEETCPMIVFSRESSFQPYAVGSVVGIYKDLSYHVNKMFGHQVIYFKVTPNTDSTDYIFKEYTLYGVSNIKCTNVLVENNEFPDNKPTFDEQGIDYLKPFEIQIDKGYFESIFGTTSEPRKKDFLYFPMLNRMYEVQGSYLMRTIMMQPTYYKLSLVIFRPNIDIIMKPEERQFLDNLLLDSETLFAKQVDRDIKDTVNPQQDKTITNFADETRKTISSKMTIRPLDFFWHYTSLIENYYDMMSVPSNEYGVDYKQKPLLSTDSPNMTYTCLFNIRSSNTELNFLYGKEFGSPVPPSGLTIRGRHNSTNGKLNISVDINGSTYQVNTSVLSTSHWYALAVSISKEFNQLGIFIYDILEDTTDTQNHTDFVLKNKSTIALSGNIDFSIDDTYKILGSNLFIANIRLFNKTLKEEQHPFILSQLFIKDESQLYFIDNQRPRLNVSYLSRNR